MSPLSKDETGHVIAEQPDKPDLASVENSLASGPPPPPPPHAELGELSATLIFMANVYSYE